MYNIGVDLGGTVIKVGLTQDGKVVGFKTFDSVSKAIKPNLSFIESAVNSLLDTKDIPVSQLSGIGLAFPGIVNPVNRTVISTNNKYDDAKEIDFPAWIKRNWDVPFYMDNDARAAVLGEWQCGAGRGYKNIVMVTIGTGIGTGVVLDGNLLYGKHFQAGSLGGHFVVDYRGRLCSCGNRGCVEALASSAFLTEIIREDENLSGKCRRQADTYDFNCLFSLWRSGDPDALAICNRCMDVWAAGIICYIHAYDPEIVILGGGIMRSGDVILPYLQQRINALTWCPSGKVGLVASKLGDKAAILGVAYGLSILNEQ
ncbi:MAG: ROK family protein [Tannerella sp.]|jgi:glucokinase|nr:ROK family protein [Tannerella sp.]